jgi:ubiquinone/menaquinone biosynthesis C-methylase UbiE
MVVSKSSQDYALIVDLYDDVIPYSERPDVDFYVQAALETGEPALEVGCGTGRVLIPTARAELQITGLDRSDVMFNICSEPLRQSVFG